MQYPLDLRFKLLTFGQRITATDASGTMLMFIKQKMFKLKEKVDIYPDANQTQVIFQIEADRMIDWSANYHFTDGQGNAWGAVRRKGMRSLWKAHYEIMQDDQIDMTISEESPFKKIMESVLSEIPIIGFVATYLINPSYVINRPDGTPVLRLIKQPAVWEGKYTIEKVGDLPEDDELRSLMALIMLVLLERRRG